MGEGLTDNMGEENASGSEWRTAHSQGIGLTEQVEKALRLIYMMVDTVT